MTGHPRRSTAVAVLVVTLMVPLMLGQFGACTNDVPSLTLISMDPSGRIDPGAIVQLSYTAQDRDNNADITLFYDADGAANTGDEILIAMVKEDGAEFGAIYNWLTVGVPPLTYHVGATIRDSVHPSITRYYTNTITIPGAAMSQFDLTQISVIFDGSVWQGFNFGAQAGFAVAAIEDVGSPDEDTGYAPDLINEFIIVARFGRPFNRGNVGEAYLVFGQDGGRYLGYFELNGVPEPIAGALFVGPPVFGPGITEGIVSVVSTPDHDQDGRAEILFGLPYVNELDEDADYDPCDQDSGSPYLDGLTPNGCSNDPAQAADNRDALGRVTTGYVAIIPGSEIFRDLDTPLDPGGFVLDLDFAGQLEDETTDNPFSHHVGARLKPMDASEGFSTFSRYGQTVARMASILSGFGGEEDWLISAPNKDGNTGSVEVIDGQNLWDFSRPGASELSDTASFIEGLYTWPLWFCSTDDPDVLCIRNIALPYTVRIDGESPDDLLGEAHSLGDFNNDGPPDLTCGAPGADPAGLGDAGITYVVFGRVPFGDVNVGDIDDPDPLIAVPGIELEGTNIGDRFGTTQDSAGDFNGDGIPDWVIGAPRRDGLGRFDNGMAAVIFGDPLLLGSYTADQLATPDLPAVVIYGANDNDFFGSEVAPAGDINGDGFDDILISAPGFDALARVDSGAVYVIFGGPAISGAIDARLLATDTLPGRIYFGPRPGEMVGSVAAAGDVDDDGFGDILIGNPNADPDGRTNAGEAYLIYGFRR